jgi:hypothetical protein
MKVNPLSIGPILGAVTGTNARIFGRADYQNHTLWERLNFISRKKHESVGVVRVRAVPNLNFSTPIVFQTNPNFDMTGVAIINNLSNYRHSH